MEKRGQYVYMYCLLLFGGKELPWLSTYKYLGCEVKNCSSMVVQAGENRFSGIMCLAEETSGVSWGGERKLRLFMQLMQSLVESVLLYGAKIFDAFLVGWFVRGECVTFWLRVTTNPLFEGKILCIAALEAARGGRR